VAYFKRDEFLCPCCGQGETARVLVLWLDLLRRAWGGPVLVNSGRRCVAHNIEVGGSKTSRHLIGCAADIRPAGGGSFADFLVLASKFCRLPDWEFLPSPTFIHVAAPRKEAAALWYGDVMTL
jgi:hypothetical protein